MTARPEFEIAAYEDAENADVPLDLVDGEFAKNTDGALSSEDIADWRIALSQVTNDMIQNGDAFGEGSQYRKAWEELHQYRRDYADRQRAADDAEHQARWSQTAIGRIALLFGHASERN
jgi:hypothetical protein